MGGVRVGIGKEYVYLERQAKCRRAVEATRTFMDTHMRPGLGLDGANMVHLELESSKI
jgi:hypothetical protein